jgi:hypothetical protein
MEDTDQDDSNALEQDRLEELEAKLKTHQKVIYNLKIIGAGMSGDVFEGFDYSVGPVGDSSD